MASVIEICNMALSHTGRSGDIASLDERTDEAVLCKQFYNPAVLKLLRDFPWPFATKRLPLVLVSDLRQDENSLFDYAYRYPADCIKPRLVPRVDRRYVTGEEGYEFRESRDELGRLIETNADMAQLEYTQSVDNSEIFPEDFVLALSYYLAFLMSPRLTQGDPFKLRDSIYGQYQLMLADAKRAALDSAIIHIDIETDLLRSREQTGEYNYYEDKYGDREDYYITRSPIRG